MKDKLEQERVSKLLELYKSGNTMVREELIEALMPLAEKIAEEFFGLGIEDEDIVSSSYEGLVVAVDELRSIDCRNNYYFMTRVIEEIISTMIMGKYGVSSKNMYLHRNAVKVLRAKRNFVLSFGVEPNVKELSEYSGLDEYDIAMVSKVSDKSYSVDLRSMDIKCQGEVIKSVVDPESIVLNRELLDLIASYKTTIPFSEYEKEVLELTYYQGKSAKEIASIIGVDPKSVVNAKKRILKKFKFAFSKYDTEDVPYSKVERVDATNEEPHSKRQAI